MPDSLIERVAKTIRSGMPEGAFVSRKDALLVAKQVLTAIRSPTETMTDHAADVLTGDDYTLDALIKKAERAWQAMIDAALEDDPEV